MLLVLLKLKDSERSIARFLLLLNFTVKIVLVVVILWRALREFAGKKNWPRLMQGRTIEINYALLVKILTSCNPHSACVCVRVCVCVCVCHIKHLCWTNRKNLIRLCNVWLLWCLLQKCFPLECEVCSYYEGHMRLNDQDF